MHRVIWQKHMNLLICAQTAWVISLNLTTVVRSDKPVSFRLVKAHVVHTKYPITTNKMGDNTIAVAMFVTRHIKCWIVSAPPPRVVPWALAVSWTEYPLGKAWDSRQCPPWRWAAQGWRCAARRMGRAKPPPHEHSWKEYCREREKAHSQSPSFYKSSHTFLANPVLEKVYWAQIFQVYFGFSEGTMESVIMRATKENIQWHSIDSCNIIQIVPVAFKTSVT